MVGQLAGYDQGASPPPGALDPVRPSPSRHTIQTPSQEQASQHTGDSSKFLRDIFLSFELAGDTSTDEP